MRTLVSFALSAMLLASSSAAPRAALADASVAPAEVSDARAQSDAAIATMESLSNRLRLVLQRTRGRERSSVVACVDEALTRVNVALRRGRDAVRRQNDAWDRGDAEAARAALRELLAYVYNARAAASNVDYCFAR
jgi:hypothetical protein